jgi:lipopolysaccharide transport system ATP-binding protein
MGRPRRFDPREAMLRAGGILVSDVGKRFREIDRGRPSTLKGLFLSATYSRRKQFWGLRHVDFSIKPGRAVGVVGRNGAGKSTLLRIVGGVTRSNEGKVSLKGRIGALLEIGAGLTDDLTGRENVYLMGVISGMLRSEVEERLERIIAFAELADVIDRPVRTYSTGMKMRLAFSVAIHVEPDVLLIDEVLAVGDGAFQQKCLERVRAIKASGCTVFLVSHDPEQIRAICDDVLFLREGRMVAYGPMDETMALYEASIEEAAASAPVEAPIARATTHLEQNVNRFGSREAEIRDVRLMNIDDQLTGSIVAGEGLRVRFSYSSPGRLDNIIALVGLYTGDLSVCMEINSLEEGLTLHSDTAEQTLTLDLLRLDLARGQYFVTVGLFSSDWKHVLDYHAEAYPLVVDGEATSKGCLRPPSNWTQA